jgi:hypothetical protein
VDYYERAITTAFGQSTAVRVAFLFLVLLFVGLPYLTRTWRDLFSARHKIDLYRAHLELLRIILELAERAATPNDLDSVRTLIKDRTNEILAGLKWPPPSLVRHEPASTSIRSSQGTPRSVSLFLLGSFAYFLGSLLLAFIPGLSVFFSVVCVVVAARAKGSRRDFYLGLGLTPIAFFVFTLIVGLLSKS